MMLGRRASSLGVDIGSSSIKAVKAQNAGNSIKIVNYSVAPLPSPADGKGNIQGIDSKIPVISKVLTSLNIKKEKFLLRFYSLSDCLAKFSCFLKLFLCGSIIIVEIVFD